MFDRVETWIFDLDNTLYQATEALMQDQDRKLRAFVSAFLDVDHEEARRIQKAYFREYGLTLRGLMVNHGLDPERYIAAMGPTEVDEIAPAPHLARAIARLPGRKLIYTNAWSGHALAVLERLGIADQFAAIHDIRAAHYVPKPDVAAYRALCQRHCVDATTALMIDDVVHNLGPAAEIGMTTVWLKTGAEWARGAGPGAFVHHVVENLADWLEGVADALARPGDD